MRMFGNRVLRRIFGPKMQVGTRDCITRNFMIGTPQKYYSGDQIKRNEMGGACSTYGRQQRCIRGFGGET